MKIIIAIVVVIIVLAGGGIALAKHHDNSKPKASSSTSSSMGNMGKTSNSSSTPTVTSAVTISNFAFSPASISVKKGTTVTWTNQDSVAHTVTENDGQAGPASGDIDQGKSYSFTYNATGTFKYHCSIHPDMLGTVTVTD